MALTTALGVVHHGRTLELRAVVTDGDWQIWVYEAARRIYLYGLVPLEHVELEAAVAEALAQAKHDIENGAIVIPVVRTWPRSVP